MHCIKSNAVKRLLRLGEEKNRIYKVGATQLDEINKSFTSKTESKKNLI